MVCDYLGREMVTSRRYHGFDFRLPQPAMTWSKAWVLNQRLRPGHGGEGTRSWPLDPVVSDKDPGPSIQLSSVAQSCRTLSDPMNCSMPGLPVHHQLPEFAQTHIHWVSDTIQPSHPLSFPSSPSIFPSIRVFSNESVLPIRWPKNWRFSFSISPSNDYSGLISCRIDRFELLAV